MNFIDTHTHLYLKDFDLGIDEEIKKSISLGIKKFIYHLLIVLTQIE